MPDYQELYFSLFNAVTDAIELLQKAQLAMEEHYINISEDASEPAEE
jgi:hypothetical protein